jgi:hypothetical protein
MSIRFVLFGAAGAAAFVVGILASAATHAQTTRCYDGSTGTARPSWTCNTYTPSAPLYSPPPPAYVMPPVYRDPAPAPFTVPHCTYLSGNVVCQ